MDTGTFRGLEVVAHALDEIASKTAVSDHDADAPEGVAGFQQKREPRFNRWLEGQ